MNILRKQSGLIIGIVVVLFLVLGGCGQEEIQKLRSENEALKNKVASLEQEISKLKETADYHYQKGVSFLSANNYEGAKVEFETVLEKYPLSPLVTSAKQQVLKIKDVLAKIETQRIAEEKRLEAQRRAEERRRQEEEKYRPKSDNEAIAEWKKFRREEDKYKGTITTWRFQVSMILTNENILGHLGGSYNHQVAVLGPEGFTYQAGVLLGKVPRVREKDWIVVTGKFKYVSPDNVVVLSPIRVINEGYK